MLVTFTSPAYADITMFGNVAISLLQMMGHSGTVPSALSAEDIPAALLKLETALKAYVPEDTPNSNTGNEDEEPEIPLANRALPLIELLEASAKDQCNVMWDRN